MPRGPQCTDRAPNLDRCVRPGLPCRLLAALPKSARTKRYVRKSSNFSQIYIYFFNYFFIAFTFQPYSQEVIPSTSFWNTRGHRCPPFSPPARALKIYLYVYKLYLVYCSPSIVGSVSRGRLKAVASSAGFPIYLYFTVLVNSNHLLVAPTCRLMQQHAAAAWYVAGTCWV